MEQQEDNQNFTQHNSEQQKDNLNNQIQQDITKQSESQQPGMSQQGMNQPNMNQQGWNQPGMSQPNMNQQGWGQPGMSQPNMNQQGWGQPGMNQPNMNQQGWNQPGMNQPNMNQQGWNQPLYSTRLQEIQTKNIWNQSLLALFIMGMAVILIQVIASVITGTFFPQVAEKDWYVWALTAFAMICVALPLFYLITRSIPDSPKGDIVKLKASQFFKYFLVCAAVMYITNFLSVMLLMLISMIKGENFNDLNPLANLFTRSNIAYSILYAAIAAPIIEELIFRKILLNKLRRYGDVPAILITAFAFGLFHMNLAQFFYAMALGMIFAYVTIRTNTVRYSILLHIMINSIGTAVAPLAVKPNIVFSSIIVMWVFGVIAAGIVILILNIKKIKLYNAAWPLAKKSDYFLNAGTILYTLMCLVMIVIASIS